MRRLRSTEASYVAGMGADDIQIPNIDIPNIDPPPRIGVVVNPIHPPVPVPVNPPPHTGPVFPPPAAQ